MKKLFTLAMFFWACTFTQQAQIDDSLSKNHNSFYNYRIHSEAKNLTDSTLASLPLTGKG